MKPVIAVMALLALAACDDYKQAAPVDPVEQGELP